MSNDNGNGAVSVADVVANGTTVPDGVLEGFIRHAVGLARGGMRHATRTNLAIASDVVKGIHYDLTNGGCTSFEDISDRREDVIGRFSRPISRATGISLTTSKLAEFLRIHYMVAMLDDDTAKLAMRVSWESLRVLAQWSIHRPGETHFVPMDGDTPGEYEESWTIREGCEAKLADLIVRQTKGKPLGRADLVKALRKHEAELAGEDTEDENTGPTFKDKTQFIASIESRAKALKMSKSELSDWLISAKLVQITKPVIDHSKLSVTDAGAIGAALVSAGNVQAIRELQKRLHKFESEMMDAMKQPATRAKPELNDTSRPNNDPTG